METSTQFRGEGIPENRQGKDSGELVHVGCAVYQLSEGLAARLGGGTRLDAPRRRRTTAMDRSSRIRRNFDALPANAWAKHCRDHRRGRAKQRGPIGAVAAVSGFILIPWTIGLSHRCLILRHIHLECSSTYPRWTFSGSSRAVDRDGDQTADRASRPPGRRSFAAFAFAGIVVFNCPHASLGLAPFSIVAARIESARL